MWPSADTIDDYLAGLPADRRRALEDLRAKIEQVAPGVVECISYRMPAFRLDGAVIAGFAATAKGCSYFPFSGSTLGTLRAELAGFEQTKSSLHFSPAKPLSLALVRKLITARVAETEKTKNAKKAKKTTRKRKRTKRTHPRGDG